MITIIALILAFFLLPAPWNVVVPIVAAVVDIAETALFLWWSKRRRTSVGIETLVGRRAVAVSRLAPRGQVKLDGEIWEARSDEPVDAGAELVVRRVDGLVLGVEPAGDPS
ncbi:MAG TPA: NfeD family protein [Gaiellaceae bacterium]